MRQKALSFAAGFTAAAASALYFGSFENPLATVEKARDLVRATTM